MNVGATPTTTPTTNRIIVNKTYVLQKKIGEGSFGKIFLAEHKDKHTALSDHKDNKDAENVAIKLIAIEHKSLWQNEITIYERLKGIKCIPSLYAIGIEGKYNYIVMELLDQNLEELRRSYGVNMHLNVVLHLGGQMLNIIESIHEKGILHRDLKPSNFLLKTNRASGISELYLIDFGLAGSYLDDSRQHIMIKPNERLIGTMRYMSANVQQGFTASRRDDLESLSYILFYLQKGELPWQNSGEMSTAIKLSFGWAYATMYAGEFILFNQYCRNLPFSAQPNYTYLRNLLTNLKSIS